MYEYLCIVGGNGDYRKITDLAVRPGMRVWHKYRVSIGIYWLVVTIKLFDESKSELAWYRKEYKSTAMVSKKAGLCQQRQVP